MGQKEFRVQSTFSGGDLLSRILFFVVLFASCFGLVALLFLYLYSKMFWVLGVDTFLVITGAVTLGLVALILIWEKRWSESNELIFNGDKLIIKKGLIFRRLKEIDLSSISQIKFDTTVSPGGRGGPSVSYKVEFTATNSDIIKESVSAWGAAALREFSSYLKEHYPHIHYSSNYEDKTFFKSWSSDGYRKSWELT